MNCPGERAQIIQEYIDDRRIGFVPKCEYFTQTARSEYFSYTELSRCFVTDPGDYSWALIKRPLVVPKEELYGLDRWRQLYGEPRNVNSAYRHPACNQRHGGATQSRHMHGDAVDLRNESRTEEEWLRMADTAWGAGADWVEPRNGPCMIGCVHGDWRFTDHLQYAQR
ncbi:MAG: D-Ala-D-Ala carboxypeptidase family metallohydrolase [Candidatus Binatia bacterium]